MRSARHLFAPILLLTSGCAHYHVHTPEPERVGTPYFAQSTGGWVSREDVEAKECIDGLEEVRVKRNFGQSIVTFLTLGLISPVDVQYYCRKPDPPTGTIELDGGGVPR